MDRIILLLGANDAYAMPMTVAAYSALSRIDPSREVELHVQDDGISDVNRARAERILTRAHPRAILSWRKAQLADFMDVNVGQYSMASIIRLMMPYLFGPEVGRVLYIDSDLIVEDDVSPLFDMDLGDHPIWAVQNGAPDDFNNIIRQKFPDTEAPDDAIYFNSGVLLVNLPQWRARKVTERTLDFLRQHSDKLSFPDQDALNAVTAGRWGRLPARWNKQIIRLGQPECAPLSERGILHYTSYKPWTPSYSWPGNGRFHREYIRSGWTTGPSAWLSVGRLLVSQFYSRNRVRLMRRLNRPARRG